ncbi:MAG: methylmalonyl-CoA epimerase [Bacteroidetes bacterium]|jgi:methylmalonyl-CoA/ethylmalonyl-CoA epimerase|nr:methylmalonyl-CoA epimerase [Bacteroidota bacterium]|tara:strand:+ start:315 stop:713 length:399 start_codon:yes stop_codon:yes gene_type:complete
MKRIDHIGIAVLNLSEAEKVFTDVLGSGPIKTEAVVDESVRVSFFQAGESKVELLESTDPDGPIARHIAKRGEGLHHVAFHVDDLDAELVRLKNLGYRVISGPKPGADQKTIAFLHPADSSKVLVELCADRI